MNHDPGEIREHVEPASQPDIPTRHTSHHIAGPVAIDRAIGLTRAQFAGRGVCLAVNAALHIPVCQTAVSAAFPLAVYPRLLH